MYFQVTNTTLNKFNQIQISVEQSPNMGTAINREIRKHGWQTTDCKVNEIRPELVEAKYRGADGKNIPSGQKQYKTRAKSRNNLNMKVNVKINIPSQPAEVV